MQIIETIKAHPVMTGAGVLVAIIAVYMLSGSSASSDDTTSTSTVDQSALAAGVELQKYQSEVAAQANATAAGLQANQDNNATSLALAKIQSDYGYSVAELSYTAHLADVNADIQTSSLAAQLEQKQIEADSAESLAYIGTINNQINTAASVQQSLIASQTKVATQSWFSKLFG